MNITTSNGRPMAVDREFVNLVLAPWPPCGSPGAPLVTIWEPSGRHWPSLGAPVAFLWLPWDALGHQLGPIWVLLALPWGAFGHPGAPWALKAQFGLHERAPSRFFDRRPQWNHRLGIHPRNPLNPQDPLNPRIRCRQLQLGTSLPHAPGVRMT